MGSGQGAQVDAARVLALANRVLDNEGVLDAFGHVSMRHPDRADRFLLSTAKAPALVDSEDIVAFDLGSEPVDPPSEPVYSERVMHGSIYRSRPDVHAICHHHAAAVMPFCITDTPLVPVNQLGGAMGGRVPVWDSQDEFGDTNLLVTRHEEADSIAAALGENWMLLLKRHGAMVVGRSLKELVFRTVFGCENARSLATGAALGPVTPLTEEEMRLTADPRPDPIERCWSYWLERLDRGGRTI